MIYIKIKHIKNFLMIVACLFLTSFNYFTYAETNSASDVKSNVCDTTIDSDCDGLTNSEEKLYGTNLDNIDTDGDSYSDMVEIESGYDPLKPAPGDKIITQIATALPDSNNIVQDNTSSATDAFSQDLVTLIQSKEGQPITTDEVNNLVSEQLLRNGAAAISLETLPEIDRSRIKVLKQDYSMLSNKERAEKETMDAVKYVENMSYLLLNNAPVPLTTKADLIAFKEDLFSHLADLSGGTSDFKYFSDLGDRLEIFSNQAIDVEVPETIVDSHVKLLRIIKGILTLKDSPNTADDPLARALLFAKAGGYVNLMNDFFQNDFQNYAKHLSDTYNNN